MQTYTIDATDKKLGRLAGEAAVVLLGKHEPTFERHVKKPVRVRIVNANRLAISPKKFQEKTYAQFSGYPGGIRHRSLGRMIEVHGVTGIIRSAIYNMLPPNRLRQKHMNNLVIETTT